jgi:hypothetical protein
VLAQAADMEDIPVQGEDYSRLLAVRVARYQAVEVGIRVRGLAYKDRMGAVAAEAVMRADHKGFGVLVEVPAAGTLAVAVVLEGSRTPAGLMGRLVAGSVR